MERTLVLIKPDAVQRQMVGKIISRFEEKGFQIIDLKMIHFSLDAALNFYKIHKNKPFYTDQCLFMSSGHSIVLILEGKNAIKAARNVLDGIRNDYSMSIRQNLVHASDSPSAFRHEFAVLSKYARITNVEPYTLDTNKWILTAEERKEVLPPKK